MRTASIALKLLLVMTLLTGVLYPLAITGIAKLLFPSQAAGSLIQVDGKLLGSELIGQNFTSDRYFWSRPSAIGYNPMPSSGSNLGPTSQTLKKLIDERRSHLLSHHNNDANVPEELLLASGSGLDPHITPAAAKYQADRVSTARNFTSEQRQELLDLIVRLSETPTFGFLGELRVNVLRLNLALDSLN